MKKLLFIALACFVFNCSNDEDVPPVVDLTIYNAELSVIENLDNGVPVTDIIAELGIEVIYGLEYKGGFIFHIDETDGTIMVATDYSVIGTKSWGDHFDLTNSALIGAGLENTQQIVDGNLNDNSTVVNGLEFGSDDYVFKIASDLNYRDYDDWFIPSKDSMEAIFNNVHAQGMGNFDEAAFYWTSTKEGYQPYVMSFNGSFFGGECFLGSCFDSNTVLIARKF